MTAWWRQLMRCFICWVLSMKLWGPTGMTSLLSTRRILNEEWRKTLRRETGVRRTSSRRTMWIIWILRTMYPPFSTTDRRISPRTGRTCCLSSTNFQTRHGLSLPLKIHSPWLMRWEKASFILSFSCAGGACNGVWVWAASEETTPIHPLQPFKGDINGHSQNKFEISFRELKNSRKLSNFFNQFFFKNVNYIWIF